MKMEKIRKVSCKYKYTELKEYIPSFLIAVHKRYIKTTFSKAVTHYYKGTQYDILVENGLHKFYLMLIASITAIELNDFDEEFAFEVWSILSDFNLLEYDSLVRPDELSIIKKDIQTVYDYIKQKYNFNESE